MNGTGKTTSIAKLAQFVTAQGKSVMLAAGDTFRAAAVEQLTLWAQRLGCAIVTKPSGTDPAAVAFAGCDEGAKAGVDVVIIDTAGRLHNQANLMKELEKVRKVIDKRIPGAPHECLLVIDATTGQNGLNQAKHFSDSGRLHRHRPGQTRRHRQGRRRRSPSASRWASRSNTSASGSRSTTWNCLTRTGLWMRCLMKRGNAKQACARHDCSSI